MTAKEIRKSKGLTQAQMADYCGCEQNYICQVENSVITKKLAIRALMCERYGCSLVELLGGRDNVLKAIGVCGEDESAIKAGA